ncbi:MAG: Rieske 2Fe-2S domain-containing protein, partial [Opitutaceae bacterium]|nr:Rieske 2Fe-2S domain-containing protein [Verrucomicrobiales bacterium]
LPLDQDDNQLLTKDGRHLRCHHHGALYDASSGQCVLGPCEGAGLKPLKIEIKNGAAWLLT